MLFLLQKLFLTSQFVYKKRIFMDPIFSSWLSCATQWLKCQTLEGKLRFESRTDLVEDHLPVKLALQALT